jgi:hypothetical protein
MRGIAFAAFVAVALGALGELASTRVTVSVADTMRRLCRQRVWLICSIDLNARLG